MDQSTLKPETPASRERSRVPALTILMHPDVARVGELARLGAGETLLSRTGPQFARKSSVRAGAPLADPHLSRRAMSIRRSGETFTLRPGGSPVVVDGEPLAGVREVSAGDGVVLELAGRVVLLLHLVGPPREPAPAHGLVGESDAIEDLRLQIARVADLPVAVLVRGETGVGKELVARGIHAASTRAARPFVGVNIAAVPPSLAASELFGHVRGAFTGALRDRPGCFEQADGGTLFLDEVGDCPLDVQAMLLRALETGDIQPVGASAPRRVDVRLVAATDADLEKAVAEERFRSPLLHRLAGYELHVPPLRERRDDIGRLVVHFLRRELGQLGELHRLAERSASASPCIAADVMARLARYPWPGNVRELANVVRHIAIASRGAPELALDEALQRKLTVAASPAAGARRESIHDDELVAALAGHGWRPGAAAAALGISRTTIYQLIDASPAVRKARDLSAAEIEESRRAAGGDVDAMAAALRVSPRGLRLRMHELKIDSYS